MTEEDPLDNFTISRNRAIGAGLYTATFLGLPIVIYGKQSLFTRFCNFHTRVFKLGLKSPGQVVGLSIILSFIYTSLAFPVYYNGLLSILGLQSIYDIQGVARKSAEKTYKKYPKMHEIDEKILFELDKVFGIDPKRTKEFIESSFGESISSKPK